MRLPLLIVFSATALGFTIIVPSCAVACLDNSQNGCHDTNNECLCSNERKRPVETCLSTLCSNDDDYAASLAAFHTICGAPSPSLLAITTAKSTTTTIQTIVSVTPSSVLPPDTTSQNSADQGNTQRIAIIVGAVVGLIALIGIVALIFIFLGRRRRIHAEKTARYSRYAGEEVLSESTTARPWRRPTIRQLIPFTHPESGKGQPIGAHNVALQPENVDPWHLGDVPPCYEGLAAPRVPDKSPAMRGNSVLLPPDMPSAGPRQPAMKPPQPTTPPADECHAIGPTFLHGP